MTQYHLNEFALCSEFPLAADAEARSSRDIPEADHLLLKRASLDHLPSTLRKVRRQLVYDVGDGVLIEPEGLALHIDLRGRTLTVDCTDEKLPIAAAWAVHAGLGAATITHGGVPLHGAGLEIGGKSVAIMADSGSGKSTLAWFLLQQGARFANDDLVPVRWEDDQAIAYPAVSLFPKLQREAVDRHGLDLAGLLPADYGTGEEEYYVPLPCERRVNAPSPLAAAIALRPQPPQRKGLVTVWRLPEEEAAGFYAKNLHAVWLIGKWLDNRKIGQFCRRLAASVPVYAVTYPKIYEVLPDLAGAITCLPSLHH